MSDQQCKTYAPIQQSKPEQPCRQIDEQQQAYPEPFGDPRSDAVQISISHNFHNKIALRRGAHVYFDAAMLTEDELIAHIRQGGAWSPAVYRKGYRKQENLQGLAVIGLDLDYKSIAQARAVPLIAQYAAIVHSTASHGVINEHNPNGLAMTRVLFILEDPITELETARTAIQRVAHAVRTIEPDPSALEPARFFYGAESCIVDRRAGARLPMSTLWALVAQDADVPADRLAPRTIRGSSAQAQINASTTPVLEDEQHIRQQAASKRTLADIQEGRTSELWREKHKRRIADALGVTAYNSAGYSELVRCPCPHHKNGDAHPSAQVTPSGNLKCWATGDTYSIVETLALLGITPESTPYAAPGLHTSTREALLAAGLPTLARAYEFVIRNGSQVARWYSREELRAALGLDGMQRIGERAFLKSVCDKLPNTKGKTEGGFLIYCRNDTHNSSEIKLLVKGVKSAINSLPCTNPPPPPAGRGRKPVMYYLPAEGQLTELLGLQPMGRTWLTLEDLSSNKAYRAAITSSLLRYRPGNYTKQWLADRVGVSKSTIGRYVQEDETISSTVDYRLVGQLTAPEKLPYAENATPKTAFFWLRVPHTETGEMHYYPYTRESAARLQRFHPLEAIHVVRQIGNYYRASTPAQINTPTAPVLEDEQHTRPPHPDHSSNQAEPQTIRGSCTVAHNR